MTLRPDPLRMARVRLWLLDTLPPGLLHRPAEWFLAFLSIWAGAGSLARVVDSESVEAMLPVLVYRAWALCLVVGGAAIIFGLASIRHTIDGYVIWRLPLYRLGCRLMATATLVYAIALLAVAGGEAVIGSLPLFAFSATFALRLLALRGRQ